MGEVRTVTAIGSRMRKGTVPQLIGLMVLGAGLVAGYKAIRHLAGRLAAEADAGNAPTYEGVEAKNLGVLELDPASGVYRPRNS